ncbi:uncharacterized protein SPSK_05530 [Sporothrix schenckii 1099-18]|uniref:D-lactate dehydratase n=2 Tax=Sporothrix schenckii TaxID=29908 RepID=U7Q703_SPOS1|nr:uncharacterized protein SPSK_05530 [Sporothrix schenckii 1099-18]ERT02496.1 hypothetical protein HMPREF1624_00795 [Sporothrix schenckii ATCC 58251]KJR80222.1 hypothetical protein SPSK_05530 [Sporothrix schenckii 1099-18]
MAPTVLVVLTSHDKLGDTGKKTGWYLPEFAHPYDEFVDAGFDVTVASPKGGEAPLDPSSVEAFKEDASSVAFLNNKKSIWQNTQPLHAFAGDDATAAKTAQAYDALFYPGGHGPMFDLAFDKQSQRLAAAFASAGKVVSAVCHGPAALANVFVDNDESKGYLLKGRRVGGFTDAEEAAAQMDKAVPFLLESRLREVGANFGKADELWGEYVVVDGNIVTGQNPASAKGVGAAIVKAVKK